MQSYAVFENCVFRGRLERRFYLYALLRQPSLIIYAPLYILADFLSYFHLLTQKKYLEIHYSFLRRVRGLEERLKGFRSKNEKRIVLPERGVTVLSAHPRCVVEALSDCPVSAGEYSLSLRRFTPWKPAVQMLREASQGAEYRAFGTLSCPIMKDAAEKVYVYGKNRYASKFACIASCVRRFAAAAFAMLLLSCAWGIMSLYLTAQTSPQPGALFGAYFCDARLLFYNILPVFLFCLLIYALFGSTAFACGLSGIITLILSLINYFKITIRDDPLIFEDIFSLREGAAMTAQYNISLTPRKILLFAVIVAAAVIVRLFFDAKIRIRYIRPALLAGVIVLSSFVLKTAYCDMDLCLSLRSDTFAKINESVYYGVSDMTRYTASGFLHPLIYSYHSYEVSQAKPPEGYDKKATEELLSSYTYEDIPEDRRVNVIAVMLESYCDLYRFDSVEIDDGVYESLNRLRAESYSGNILTDIYGGNTIKTERSFVSGLNYYYLPTYRYNANSFAWYMREQGYRVEGGHPGQRWFYGRQSINAHMGFENYFFDEDTYRDLNGGANNAYNDVLFSQILSRLDDATDSGEPLFSFNVSYEGHGPYSGTEALYSKEYVSNEGLSEEQYNIVNNYVELINDTNIQLEKFVDELRDRDEPVVLVLFGDHLPGLGDGASVYRALGINIDTATAEGFENFYETPYIIWANDTAKEICKNGFSGDGDTVGSYFLMNELFRLCGWKGNEYMQYLSDFRESSGISALNLYGKFIKNGEVIITEPEGADAAALNEYKSVQYYVKNNFAKKK